MAYIYAVDGDCTALAFDCHAGLDLEEIAALLIQGGRPLVLH